MTKPRMRRSLAFASLALVLTAAVVSTRDRWGLDFAQYKGQAPPAAGADDEFRFVIVGDRTGGAVWGVMPQVFREINHLDPDFVISVGDLIDGWGDDSETVTGIWEEFDKEVALLKVPFVYMPGNHDIWSATSRGVYEARYGPTYRSFNYRGLHFITLDTEEAAGHDFRDGSPGSGGRIEGKQLEWLREDIAQNRHARRILLFMHRPIWQYGHLNDIYPLLEGLPVSIFAGHYHKYSYQEIRGIPHIVLGATAASMPEDGVEAYGRFRHYAMATVRGDQFKLALIRLGGVMSPNVVLEDEAPSVRRLADAFAIRREGDGANTAMRLVFRNPLNVPVKVQVQKVARTAGKSDARQMFPADEPSLGKGEALDRVIDWQQFVASGSGTTTEYRVFFRFNNAAGEPQSIDFPVEPRARRRTAATARPTPPKIDGDLSDWADARWESIADPSELTLGADRWEGPQDLSAQFAVAEDDKNVYLAVRVADDNVNFATATSESDSVEIFTAAPHEREISFSGDKDWHRLVVTPSESSLESEASRGAAMAGTIRDMNGRSMWGRDSVRRELSGAQAMYVRQANGYVLEIALPRDQLGWTDPADPDTELDIAINDRDSGDRRKSQLTWSGTSGNANSSRYYGRIRLPVP